MATTVMNYSTCVVPTTVSRIAATICNPASITLSVGFCHSFLAYLSSRRVCQRETDDLARILSPWL